MYKVFFNNKVLYLGNQNTEVSDVNRVYKFENIDIQYIIQDLMDRKDKQESIGIYHHNLDILWNTFCGHFIMITASGGIVENNQNELLFIKRKGKWDLPKGKCEKSEGPEACAEREIEEECGIGDLKMKSKIHETYHTYELRGNIILKRTYWYLFKYTGNEKLVPQTEEEISEVKWIPKEAIPNVLTNTYLSIIDVVKAFANE